MKYTIHLLFFLFLLLSCNKVENEIPQKKDLVISKSNSFVYKLKNEPKYFLKFWKNMSKNDFERVKKILIKEGKLDKIYGIKYGKNSSLIEPIILEDTVRGIKLITVNDAIYSLYQEKYQLPNLVKKSSIGICFKELNPCYLKPDCDNYLRVDKNIKEVNLEEVIQNTNLSEFIHKYYNFYLPKYSIELENDNATIIIEDDTETIERMPVGWLLNKKPEHNSTSNFFYPKKNNSDDIFISRDLTRYRYVVLENEPNIIIEYYPIKYLKQRKEYLKRKRKMEKEKESKEINKKTKELIKDI
jgi:hypothetical protein